MALLRDYEMSEPRKLSPHAQMLLLNFALASAARTAGDEYAKVTGELRAYIIDLESRPSESIKALSEATQ